MAITFNTLTRPKLNTTIAFANQPSLTTTLVEDDTDKTLTIKTVETVNPASFTVTGCTTVNTQLTVTTTNNKFVNVKVGDPVSGTGIANGTTVATKTSNTSITLSAAATGSGTVTLTFDPPSVTYVLQTLVLRLSGSNSTLSVTGDVYRYDGTVLNGSETTLNAVQTLPLPSVTHNLDSTRNNIRDNRTDS